MRNHSCAAQAQHSLAAGSRAPEKTTDKRAKSADARQVKQGQNKRKKRVIFYRAEEQNFSRKSVEAYPLQKKGLHRELSR